MKEFLERMFHRIEKRRQGQFLLRPTHPTIAHRAACFRLTTARLFMLLLALVLPAAVPAQFLYSSNGDAITITGYTGGIGAVTIPDTIAGHPVTSIGELVFSLRAGLTSVAIPKSVSSIGDIAFSACPDLKVITVDPLNLNYSSLDGVLFNKSHSALITCPGGKRGSYIIPNSVTSIVGGAFALCAGLTSVAIPSSVIRIGDSAFYECLGLTTATISDSVTIIGAQAFFGCASLKSVTIGNGVATIGAGAFSGCTGLMNVALPNSVTSIENSAFSACTGLTAIMVEILNSNYSSLDGVVFNKNGSALLIYPGGKEGSYAVPNSVISIGDYSFLQCAGLSSVTIPNSVTRIGNSAFYGCVGLTSVTIPNSVVRMQQGTFSGCTGLTSVFFTGNAPEAGFLFESADRVIVYYRAGTTGWESTFSQRPTVLWDFQAQTSDPSFGVWAGKFGFTLTGARGLEIVVEVTTDLSTPEWSGAGTVTLTEGTASFSDAEWMKYPRRFYRFRSP
jgi:hypothetical protein